MSRLTIHDFKRCPDGYRRRQDIHDKICITVDKFGVDVYAETDDQTTRIMIGHFRQPERFVKWIGMVDSGE